MASPDPITVTGTFEPSPGVAPDSGSYVVAELTAPLHDADGNVIAPKVPITIALSATGTFSKQLMPTTFPGAQPTGVQWRFTAHINGVEQPTLVTPVPHDAVGLTWDLSSATPVAPRISASADVALRADVDRIEAEQARVLSAAWQLSELIGFGHSYGWLGVDGREQRYLTLMGRKLGVLVRNLAQSSSELLDYGIVQGGWTAVSHGLLTGMSDGYGAQQVATPPGLPIFVTGINDLNTNGNDATWDDFIASWKIAVRSAMVMARLGRYFPHSTASTGQSTLTGTWATALSTAQSIAPGYSYSSAAAASRRITSSVNDGGRTLCAFVLAEKVGASLAADEIQLLRDGVEITPLGLATGERVDTRELLPSTITAGATLPVPVRFEVPDDGAQHTFDLVSVNNTGFMYCGYGIETERPQLWGDVPRPMDAAYSCDGDGDTKVGLMNDVLRSVATEFGYCRVAGLDAALDKDQVNFSDNIHPNAVGHAIMADTFVSALASLGLPSTVRRFI